MLPLITELSLRLTYSAFSLPSEVHSLQVRSAALPPPAALCETSIEATCSSSSVYIVIYNSLGRHIFLPGQRPDKKHRMFIRCENRGKSMLISKLNACFCPFFPAVLNLDVLIINTIHTPGQPYFC